MREPKTKVIRDAVHGDIYVEGKYMKIIDTPEFQRLRRIKQLSVANMAFPGAEHTRFSHSIGTFYVMDRIINHFNSLFIKLGLPKITKKDKEVALLAALLHDIGHGPFSHAFEKVLSSHNYNIKHDQMSIKIIMDKKSMVNKVICNEFSNEYPELVTNMVAKKEEIKEKGFAKGANEINLQFVLSSLISSQLDADRMDYLLRDAMFTGVKCSNIDLSRIIASLNLNVNDKKEFCVCIKSKYISDIENYLAGRYQMYKNVYHHGMKCQMELIIMKILKRAKVLYNKKQINNLPNAIKSIFENKEISVEEYLSLDDNVLWYLFSVWQSSDDIELSYLCTALLSRNKFTKIPIILLDNHDYSFEFKNNLVEIFKKFGYNINLDDESFYLENEDNIEIYKISKENIYVLNQFGVLSDIVNESKIINTSIKENRKTVYISFKLLKELYGGNTEMINEINKLVRKFDSRNHIEIEKKYFVKDDNVIKNVMKKVESLGEYNMNKGMPKRQTDIYFDTEDYLLEKNDITLRIRQKENDNKYILTIKTPVVQSDQEPKALRNERYEHEYDVDSAEINEHMQLIYKHINIQGINNLTEALIIKNLRTIYDILDKNTEYEMFEMVFDNVKYENPKSGRKSSDKQIEIELKAEYDYAVKLKLLTDYINENVEGLEEDVLSKYKRGLMLTN